jgi:hypothetical protein
LLANKVTMSDKDIQRLIELAQSKLMQDRTKEQALLSLQRAGLLDKHGEFTAPYQNLAKAVESASK